MNVSRMNNPATIPIDVLHASANNFHFEPEHSAIGRKAWKSASRAAKYMTKHSQIVNPNLEKRIPRFEKSEIVLGEELGTGGFNNVYEVAKIQLIENPLEAEHAKKISSDLQMELRGHVAKHVYRESSQSFRYAIKFLSSETIEDPDRFCTGAADLVVEAKFLASLEHPNILRLRGMAASGTSGFASCTELGYFLLLDRLQFTLETRLDQWCEEEKKNNTEARLRDILHHGVGSKQREAFAERLGVAVDIAAAIRYLHDNRIIYRDLKPDNIGFDVRGDVKLFDFGLAKELDPDALGYSESYELSGNTGSLRYMAPEVALSEPYNLSADTYSFGLLFWQICSLKLPYEGMTRLQHSERVIYGNRRPPLDPDWTTPIRILMKRAWDPDPFMRPTMDSIYKILKREVSALSDGDKSAAENSRRRSKLAIKRSSGSKQRGSSARNFESSRKPAEMTGLQRSSTQARIQIKPTDQPLSIRAKGYQGVGQRIQGGATAA